MEAPPAHIEVWRVQYDLSQICRGTRVRWSGDVSGARPRHVRVRVVSRFSALQKGAETLKCKWRQMQAFSAGSVSEWCGRARLLCWAPAAATAQRPGGCRPDPGRRRASNRVAAGQQPPRGGAATVSRPNGSCLAKRFQGSCDPAIRFLPRQTVPLAKRFLPNPSCLAKRFLACGPTRAATRLPPPSFKVLPSPLGWRENKKGVYYFFVVLVIRGRGRDGIRAHERGKGFPLSFHERRAMSERER